MTDLLIYTRVRPQPRRAQMMRVRPPDPIRLIRVMDTKSIRAWLLSDPNVLQIWGPYDLFALPTSVAELTPDKLITSESPPPAPPPDNLHTLLLNKNPAVNR